jgi:hypothetical protein
VLGGAGRAEPPRSSYSNSPGPLTRPAGHRPAVAFTDRDDDSGLVTSVRLYTDTSPLFAGAG